MGKIEDRPSEVSAEQGSVVVDGPDGVAVTLTPEAAVATSARLLEAGQEAAQQASDRGDADNVDAA